MRTQAREVEFLACSLQYLLLYVHDQQDLSSRIPSHSHIYNIFWPLRSVDSESPKSHADSHRRLRGEVRYICIEQPWSTHTMSATPTPDVVNVSSAGSSAQPSNHHIPHLSARQHRESESSQGDGVRRPTRPRNNRNRQKPASATGAAAQGGTPESTSSTAQTGVTPSTRPNRRARNAKPVGAPTAGTEHAEKTVHADFKDEKVATVARFLNQRRRKFDGKLSEPTQKPARRSETKKSNAQRDTAPQQDDLTSTLIRDLSTPPYPDCLICFSAIHPMQPTWSCSPLIPISSNDGPKDGTDSKQNQTTKTPQYCWNTFHLKCIRPWASKSVKDLEDAWRARGENKRGEWRCPGCQSKRMSVPTSYWYVQLRVLG